MAVKNLADLLAEGVEGRGVLVRCDLNVPLDENGIPRWRISTISQATGIPRWSLLRYLYGENPSGKPVMMSQENTDKLAAFVSQHCRGEK